MAAVARKGSSNTFPLCVVAMELAAQLEKANAWVYTEWTPRDLNVEADALTNEDFEGFDPKLKVEGGYNTTRSSAET